MTWLTWRQFRTQSAVALGALLVAAVTLGFTGPHLLDVYNAGVALCNANQGPAAFCTNPVVSQYRLLQLSGTVLAVVPGILGIFWGAPLVARELETGTSRLAWTQSVSRTRWLAVKLSVVGLASMAAAGLFSLMVTWLSSPIDLVNGNRFAAGMFGERGITPIGYAALAFALGVTAGVLIRRTLPAMPTTILAFVAARVIMTLWVRQHLLAPTIRSLSLNAGSMGFGSSNGVRSRCSPIRRTFRTPGSTRRKSSTTPAAPLHPSSSRAPAHTSARAGPQVEGRTPALRCRGTWRRSFRTAS